MSPWNGIAIRGRMLNPSSWFRISVSRHSLATLATLSDAVHTPGRLTRSQVFCVLSSMVKRSAGKGPSAGVASPKRGCARSFGGAAGLSASAGQSGDETTMENEKTYARRTIADRCIESSGTDAVRRLRSSGTRQRRGARVRDVGRIVGVVVRRVSHGDPVAILLSRYETAVAVARRVWREAGNDPEGSV